VKPAAAISEPINQRFFNAIPALDL